MPARWFLEDHESIFSQASFSSKEPGLAGEMSRR